MPNETRTGKTRVEVKCAPSLKKDYQRSCKKMDKSMAEDLRDYMQKIVKWHKAKARPA